MMNYIVAFVFAIVLMETIFLIMIFRNKSSCGYQGINRCRCGKPLKESFEWETSFSDGTSYIFKINGYECGYDFSVIDKTNKKVLKQWNRISNTTIKKEIQINENS